MSSSRKAFSATTITHGGKAQFLFRSAYGKYSLVLLAVTLISLIPQYFKTLVQDPSALSLQLIFHGALFLGWYVLFCIQSALVSARQFALHRKLGYLSIGFALLLIISGTLMMLGTMHSYQESWSPQYLVARSSFVWAIFHTLISFTCFYSLGAIFRKNSQAHKRLMLLASLSMMSASITRFAFLPIIPIDGTAFTLLLTYVFLITPLVIDRVQYKKIHPALKWGVPIYAFTQILCLGLVASSDLGQAMAFPFKDSM